ncbi:hypothetical protein T08_12135 [Trichinella sp. T8]|nr:hypothetical protein T08_12135 [Trichinella sp. T8]
MSSKASKLTIYHVRGIIMFRNHLGRQASVAGCVNDFLEKIPFTPILENWKSLKIGYSNLTKAID